MTVVVDASVAAKWLIEEPGSDFAEKLIRSEAVIIAPELLAAELANLLWKAARIGRLRFDELAPAWAKLDELPLVLLPTAGLVGRALSLAEELDHPVYDCFYLALAEREGVPLITADRRFRDLVRKAKPGARIFALDQPAR